MKKFKLKNIEELKKIFEDNGYYPTEEILYEAYLGLKRLGSGEISKGQDIYTLCFDGPAGAGKSSFVQAYIKAAKYFLNEDIEMIKYQCNDTTGSNELVEDVSMVAAVVTKEKDKIIIPGKIVQAIKEVNKGKKVILFIDEFDKSRKETDVFFYEFLQSGEINTVQQSDLSIPPEYKSNLQVCFCKNDFRELSGPLFRRARNLLLDYMKPELFFEVATNELSNLKGIMPLINLITLIYDFAYQNRNKFDRLPAPSEMLIAIEDAYEITTGLNISGKNMYGLIFRRMFKDPDSYQTFESLINNTTEKEYADLKKYLNELKTSEEKVSTESLRKTIAEELLKSTMEDKTKELDEKIKEYEEKTRTLEKMLNDKYEAKMKAIEEQQRILLEERMKLRTGRVEDNENSINTGIGKLVLEEDDSNIIKSFNDSTEYIRRAESIFSSFNNANWTSIASMTMTKNNHEKLINEIKEMISEIEMVIYEDGILLNNNMIALVMNASLNKDKKVVYNFYSSHQITPSTYIDAIKDYIEIFSALLSENPENININALMYNDTELPLDTVMDNVYNINIDVNTLDKLNNYLSTLDLKCEDKSKVLESCIELMDNHSKKLVR